MTKRTKWLIGGVGIMVIGLALVVAVWFQPQRVFIDATVDEAAPGAVVAAAPVAEAPAADAPAADAPAAEAESGTATTVAPSGPMSVASGELEDVAHGGAGRVAVLESSDGSQVVRLEGLDVDNGPDLRVILSRAPVGSAAGEYDEGDFVDLGALKGNQGNQNYAVPTGVDATEFASVAIWCRRFNTTFNAAPIA